LIDIILDANEKFGDGIWKNVSKGKKYVVSTEVIGIKGEPYSAFLVAYFQDKNDIKTKIRWLNDFSGSKKIIKMVFTALSDKLLIAYNINQDTPVHSACHYQLLPVNQISIDEESHNIKEIYDNPQEINVSRDSELSVEQELMLENNLVWIFGSPRSGTTWFGTKLLSHKTHVMDEPKIGFHLKKLPKYTFMHKKNSSNKQKNYFFSSEYKIVWKFYLRKLILNRIYSQFRDVTNKVVIKEPYGSIGAELISECLPNSKIIILIRDGRDIIDSDVAGRSKKGWIAHRDGKPLEDKDRIPFIRRESHDWVDLIKILMGVYESFPKESIRLIRYEKLRFNTFEVMKDIYNFLKIKIEEAELKKLVEIHSFENVPSNLKGNDRAIRSALPGKWKESFSEDEKTILNEIMNKTLTKLGYE